MKIFKSQNSGQCIKLIQYSDLKKAEFEKAVVQYKNQDTVATINKGPFGPITVNQG